MRFILAAAADVVYRRVQESQHGGVQREIDGKGGETARGEFEARAVEAKVPAGAEPGKVVRYADECGAESGEGEGDAVEQ